MKAGCCLFEKNQVEGRVPRTAKRAAPPVPGSFPAIKASLPA